MSSLTRNETAAFLAERDRFVLLTHRRPDGDTVGSAAALCRGLRALGKTAHILEDPKMTPLYLGQLSGLTKAAPEAGDTLVSVDVAAPNMLPEAFEDYRGDIALRIDHHYSASSFTPLELVDHTAGACGEIIWDLLRLLAVTLDKPMAEALYTAVSTDTGCFRYANTTAHTFETAAACARAGTDLHSINLTFFETNSLAKLRLEGWMVENARFLAGGKIAICPVPRALEKELGVQEDDMGNLSGFLRSVEGVKIAATLRESGENRVKASVRAVPGYDASAVCERFGGGGHKGAAGATLTGTLEEAARALAEAMPEME